MNNMNNQPERIAVIKFYTWSKTNGNTTATAYITIDGGQLVNTGQVQHSELRVLASVEVTKAKLKELCGIAKKGY
jgi:hypothetical protein